MATIREITENARNRAAAKQAASSGTMTAGQVLDLGQGPIKTASTPGGTVSTPATDKGFSLAGTSATASTASAGRPGSAWLDDNGQVDFSKAIQQGLAVGAPASTIQGYLDQRDAKIAAAGGALDQYRDDAVSQAARQYIAAMTAPKEQPPKTQENDAYVTGKDDYGDVDYSVLLKNAIAAGASAAEVQGLLDKRTQKALDKGYSQYAYDDVYAAARDYITGQVGQQQKQEADYDLSEQLRKQKAAEIESTLAGLKEAYTKGMAEYDATLDKLPARYQAAKNAAAAQAAIAQRNFDERAAASGLNSGASGQAALDASASYRGALAQLSRSQAADAAELDRAKANLTAQYEADIARAKADGDAALANALYQEMVRIQGLEREDGDRTYQRYLDELDRQAGTEQTAYNRQQAADRTAYERQQEALDRADAKAKEEYDRKLQTADLQAQFGVFDGYAELWGMDEATVGAMVAQYAERQQTTKAQAARDLADWYAQYNDFSKLRDLGVDTTSLEAKLAAALKGGNSGGSGNGGNGDGGPAYLDTDSIYQKAREFGGSDPEGWIRMNYKALGIPYNSVTTLANGYQAWLNAQAKLGSNPNGYVPTDMLREEPGTMSRKELDAMIQSGKYYAQRGQDEALKVLLRQNYSAMTAEQVEEFNRAVGIS